MTCLWSVSYFLSPRIGGERIKVRGAFHVLRLHRIRMRACATTLASELADDELVALTSLLRTEKLKGTHVELGTAAGGTLVEMLKAYPAGERPRFVVVDTMQYFPDQLALVRKNLESNGLDPAQVEFRVARSGDAYEALTRKPEDLAFILIDANHKLKYVTQDLRWARFLKPGGILCLHDYCAGSEGVIIAVDRFLKRNKNYQRLQLTNRLLIIRKIAATDSAEISGTDMTFAKAVTPILQLKKSITKRLQRSQHKPTESS